MKKCALLLLLAGCGAPSVVLQEDAARYPELVLQGECAPSTVSTALTLSSIESRCLRSLSAPTLIDEVAGFDALFDSSCEKPAVDFAVNRVLVVPARGAREWFVFTNFVNERSDALEIGLVTRPQGALPPDTLLVLPREPARVELRWCRSVCVKNCDVAIP